MNFSHDEEEGGTMNQEAINELHKLALQVAKRQRGEDHLQSINTIRAKFWQEVAEYQQEQQGTAKLAELADIVYYSVQEYFQIEHEQNEYPGEYEHRDLTLEKNIEAFCKPLNLTVDQALQIALIKYWLRSTQPKNHEAEYQAIYAYMTGNK